MQNKLFRKGLVCGVILLFICMSIAPTSAFNNVKKSSITVSGDINDLVVTVTTDKVRYEVGELVEITINVTNIGEESIILYFDTAQQVDYMISYKEDIYLWSMDKIFLDIPSQITIDGGETFVLLHDYWNQKSNLGDQVENGSYEIDGWIFGYNIHGYSKTFYIGNRPPSAPIITGPTTTVPGSHEWTFRAIDPDGDNVLYEIDWGDGVVEKWIGPYASGEEVLLSHTYCKKGMVSIRARANDTHGAIGDWGYMDVVIVKNNQINGLPFLYFLDRFPLLEKMLSLLR